MNYGVTVVRTYLKRCGGFIQEKQVKNIIKSITILLLLLFSASLSYGIEFSFRLSGGLNYLKLGSVNRVLQDWAGEWEKRSQIRAFWNFEGEVGKFHRGIEFGGELMMTLTPRFWVSLGLGYVYGEISDTKTEITIERRHATDIRVRPNKVSAYPINLSGYFFLPLKGKISPYLKGSIGVYFAKYIDWQGRRTLPDTEFNYSSQIAEATSPAFEGGLGFAVEVDSYLRFFIEGSARKAKISGFEGEIKQDEQGTLFYFEKYDPELEFWQANTEILSEKPEGEEFRSVQEATVDFSGFSVKIGLIIKF